MANILEAISKRFPSFFTKEVEVENVPIKQAQAYTGSYNHLYAVSYNGEKNLGEIGPIKDYFLDYDSLRLRSWQSYIESEVTQTVLNKYKLWIVASGLKLQSMPNKQVLKSEGINIDTESFNEVTESRFQIWAKSKQSDYSGNLNLNLIAQEAFKNSKIGGDVLVILRVINKTLKVEMVDGCHVQSPSYGNDRFAIPESNGNTIRNGVELSPTGEHIAYHVRKQNLTFERIEAKSKSTGLTTAFLVYGLKYRLNNHRGIPLIATVLETLKKMERYKEATVATAEEVAKIAYQILHDPNSTGENPFAKQLSKAMDFNSGEDFPKDAMGKDLANQVQATTEKQALNMPIGAKVEPMHTSDGQLNFKDFYTTNIEIVCAAIGIPPNVAMSMYNDSFSASRAATKDWEHTINVNREDFTFQFYQRIYEFWLHLEIMKNKIDAPGYITAFSKSNDMALAAYRSSRFSGPLFPHIDPLKEVKAEREKLGDLARNIPLTTIEAATEALNGGDSDSNMAQFSEEYKDAKKLGFIIETPKF